MKRADYEKFSRLAPTVAAGKGSTEYFSPWDQQVELVAAALGKPEEGRALVQRIKDDYAKVAAAHPEFRAARRCSTGSSRTAARRSCRSRRAR